jgi:hypothetical protein
MMMIPDVREQRPTKPDSIGQFEARQNDKKGPV